MSQMLIFANLWHTNLNLWKTCVQAESLHHNNNNDTTTPQEKKRKWRKHIMQVQSHTFRIEACINSKQSLVLNIVKTTATISKNDFSESAKVKHCYYFINF